MHRLLLALDPVARVADDAHRHRTRQADVLHARPGRHDRGVLQDRQHRLRIPQPRLDRADDVVDILRTIKGRIDIRLGTAIPRLLVCEAAISGCLEIQGFSSSTRLKPPGGNTRSRISLRPRKWDCQNRRPWSIGISCTAIARRKPPKSPARSFGSGVQAFPLQMISSKRWPLRAHSRGAAGQIGEDWSGAFWPTPTESPRHVRRLHFLGRLESCQVVRRGGTRRSCVSVRCGWSPRSVVSTTRSGRRSVKWPGCWGSHAETVRKWVRQAEIDAGARPGVSTEESRSCKRLAPRERELEARQSLSWAGLTV